ncbi:MAG: 3'(2'),5'-bisphosphate nucleotidase [Phycisphaerales bacterium]|nr:3'(2'),5'-bisphosphate nucleotidase [Phycisphaerales bacterium]
MPSQHLHAALQAVADACRVTRLVQRSMGRVREIVKDDRSPVTIADFASQALVARALTGRLGPVRLVGEETAAYLRAPEHSAQLGATVEAVRGVWPDVTKAGLLDAIDAGTGEPVDPFWTLDPVDGTKGFLRGEQYAVALALVEGGRPVLGVLGCPNLPADFSRPFTPPDPVGRIYFAVAGEGAYEIPADDPAAHPVRMVRPEPEAGQPVRVCASVERAHSNLDVTGRVMAAVDPSHVLIQIDSQCKYAVVARGQADVYLRLPTKKGYVERIWDHAAGALVAAEAGCPVTDIAGHDLDFSCGRGLERNRGILCAPPSIHARVLAALGDAGIR